MIPITNRTILTDDTKTWAVGAFSGQLLHLSSAKAKRRQIPILTNTGTRIFVHGDITGTEGIPAGRGYGIDSYRLAEESENIDTGAVIDITEDYDGDPRPLDNGYDIGADEYAAVDNPELSQQPEIELLPLGSTLSGQAAIEYIVRDSDSAPLSLVVLYSVDGGGEYDVATMGAGGDGVTGLTSSLGGVVHTYTWDSRTDAGPVLSSNVRLQLSVNDGEFDSEPVESDVFAVDNTALAPKVYGTVKNQRSGDPLEGVLVEMVNTSTQDVAGSDTTDGSGNYEVFVDSIDVPLEATFSKTDYDSRVLSGFTAPLGNERPPRSGRAASAHGPACLCRRRRDPRGMESEPRVGHRGLQRVAFEAGAGKSGDSPVSLGDSLAGDSPRFSSQATTPVFKAGEKTFVQLNDTLITDTQYSDTDFVDGATYQYQVTAQDAGGLVSEPAGPVTAKSGLVTIWLPDVSAQVGDVLRLPINVDNATGIDPYGLDIRINYPANIVEPLSTPVERTAVTSHVTFQTNVPTPGELWISSLGEADTLRGEGHLFDAYFELADGVDIEDCGLAEFSLVAFFDDEPSALEVDSLDTAVLCVRAACLQGDLDGDQMVLSADVIMALQYAVGLRELTDCAMQSGDINGDGCIDSGDACLIQRLAVGLPINPAQSKDALRHALKADATVDVSLGEANAAPGEVVTVPVTVSDAAGLTALDLTINFTADRANLILESAAATGLCAGFESQAGFGEGQVHLSISGESGLPAGAGTVAELQFLVPATAPAPSALALTLADASLKGQHGDSFDWYNTVTRTDGAIQVLSGEGEGEGEGRR